MSFAVVEINEVSEGSWLTVPFSDLERIKVQGVIEVAKAADVRICGGWSGGPMYIEKPSKIEDEHALRQLVRDVFGSTI